MEQYEGLKDADDETDAKFLAQLCRLGILPEGYIYPKEGRSVRDLLRRRMLLVQQRTAIILSLRNMFARENGRAPGWRRITRMTPEELAKLTGPDEFLLFVAKQQIVKKSQAQSTSLWVRMNSCQVELRRRSLLGPMP